MGVGVVFLSFRLSLRKGVYIGHLQWVIMIKFLVARSNLYGSGVVGMGNTVFPRDGGKFTEIACPTRGGVVLKFMIGYKLNMGVVKKQMVYLVVWDI